jgi:hypothetical protein
MTEPEKPSAEMEEKPNPNEKLVTVFDSEAETEALVVKGLLESAGIEADLAPLSLTQYAFPNVGGTILQVRAEDAEEARRIIAENRQARGESDEEPASEEPPAQV